MDSDCLLLRWMAKWLSGRGRHFPALKISSLSLSSDRKRKKEKLCWCLIDLHGLEQRVLRTVIQSKSVHSMKFLLNCSRKCRKFCSKPSQWYKYNNSSQTISFQLLNYPCPIGSNDSKLSEQKPKKRLTVKKM